MPWGVWGVRARASTTGGVPLRAAATAASRRFASRSSRRPSDGGYGIGGSEATEKSSPVSADATERAPADAAVDARARATDAVPPPSRGRRRGPTRRL